MVTAHLPTDSHTIQTRQHHIENHQIVGTARRKIQSRVSIVCHINRVTFFRQDALE